MFMSYGNNGTSVHIVPGWLSYFEPGRHGEQGSSHSHGWRKQDGHHIHKERKITKLLNMAFFKCKKQQQINK